MNELKVVLTETAGKVLAGSLFEDIQNAVLIQQNLDKPNPQKHEAVFNQIKAMGKIIAVWALNKAIELAVIWMKAKFKAKE